MKAWDDLYKLYWTCLLEWNRSLTRQHEMSRLKVGYGDNEVKARIDTVSTSQAIVLPYVSLMMIQLLSLADMNASRIA